MFLISCLSVFALANTLLLSFATNTQPDLIPLRVFSSDCGLFFIAGKLYHISPLLQAKITSAESETGKLKFEEPGSESQRFRG